MTNAIRKVCKETQANSIKPEDITEEMLEQSLYTQISGLGLKPDLVSMS
jgi:undecaprenyl pyrophosphate synthase